MTAHPMHRVVTFSIVGPYEIEVSFEDGVVRRINFLPVLEGKLFGPLKDLTIFNAVVLDQECYTLVWPNGADFNPTTLHDWPENEAAFIALARSWAAQTSQPPVVEVEDIPEVDFSKGVRGKHYKQYLASMVTVQLHPDVAQHFPDSAAANERLRELLRLRGVR